LPALHNRDKDPFEKVKCENAPDAAQSR
jgi:hypothetical protein